MRLDKSGNGRLLPIKVVFPREEDRAQKPAGGSDPKYHVPYTPQLREVFVSRLNAIRDGLSQRSSLNDRVPGVATVKLRPTAIAKSNRPTVLFNERTCPIIGASSLGELFISVTPSGIDSLKKMVSGVVLAEKVESALTAVEEMAERHAQVADVDALIGVPLRVVLFDYANDIHNGYAHQALLRVLQSFDIRTTKTTRYSSTLTVRRVLCSSEEQVNALLRLSAIRSIEVMPTCSLSGYANPLTRTWPSGQTFPVPDPSKDYPCVGVVDSGIPTDHEQLAPWIQARESFVPAPYINPKHGSFVGGIITFGGSVLGDEVGTDGVRLLDVTVVPNSDPKIGPVDNLLEDDLVEILADVVKRHRSKVRVWNLSLSSGSICDQESFSTLAIALDAIQEENKVLFVIAAGNYSATPLRSWPPTLTDGSDRVTAPADSVRALTVGSVADRALSFSAVAEFEPSPFSRRGPGPAYLIKPDLVHFGGNCTPQGNYRGTGVFSLDQTGSLQEDVGTSFSTPRVASLAGRVLHALTTPGNLYPSTDLVKALIIHSSRHPKTGGPVRSKDEAYYHGFGIPASVDSILACTKSSATLIYEGELSAFANKIAVKDFPYPSCLQKNGKWYGDIIATLVYSPALDPQYGPEYCRTNIDVSIGTLYADSGKPQATLHGQVPLEVHQGIDWEEGLVKHGLKWSPVKRYYRQLSGIAPNPWGMSITLLDRQGHVTKDPLRFALIITITDPSETKDVYSDIALQLDARFESHSLPLRASTRVELGLND